MLTINYVTAKAQFGLRFQKVVYLVTAKAENGLTIKQ